MVCGLRGFGDTGKWHEIYTESLMFDSVEIEEQNPAMLSIYQP